MNQIDHKRFFSAYRRQFGAVRQEQVAPLDRLINFINADATITDYRHAAYMLSTVLGECGDTYEPVEEGFYLGRRAAGTAATTSVGGKQIFHKRPPGY